MKIQHLNSKIQIPCLWWFRIDIPTFKKIVCSMLDAFDMGKSLVVYFEKHLKQNYIFNIV